MPKKKYITAINNGQAGNLEGVAISSVYPSQYLLKIEYFAVSNIPSKFTFPVKMTDNANNTGPKQQKNFNKEYCFSERINKL